MVLSHLFQCHRNFNRNWSMCLFVVLSFPFLSWQRQRQAIFWVRAKVRSLCEASACHRGGLPRRGLWAERWNVREADRRREAERISTAPACWQSFSGCRCFRRAPLRSDPKSGVAWVKQNNCVFRRVGCLSLSPGCLCSVKMPHCLIFPCTPFSSVTENQNVFDCGSRLGEGDNGDVSPIFPWQRVETEIEGSEQMYIQLWFQNKTKSKPNHFDDCAFFFLFIVGLCGSVLFLCCWKMLCDHYKLKVLERGGSDTFQTNVLQCEFLFFLQASKNGQGNFQKCGLKPSQGAGGTNR